MFNKSLEMERENLLLNWSSASQEEKVKILVKIMDIDESLASKGNKTRKKIG